MKIKQVLTTTLLASALAVFSAQAFAAPSTYDLIYDAVHAGNAGPSIKIVFPNEAGRNTVELNSGAESAEHVVYGSSTSPDMKSAEVNVYVQTAQNTYKKIETDTIMPGNNDSEGMSCWYTGNTSNGDEPVKCVHGQYLPPAQ